MLQVFRAAIFVCAVCLADVAWAQAPISYRLSFPEREHRLMDVDVTFPDLPPVPLKLVMSRASPGRYALHDFAKNVFDVQITDEGGKPLQFTRPSPHEWDVAAHGSIVRVHYRVFGDRIDGTYLAIDSTHAHINMPSALMWARDLDQRPSSIRFEAPAGSNWRVATQLLPTRTDPFTFTAPTMQYLMDSPTEFSNFAVRTFSIAEAGRSQTFRLVAHHTGTDAELEALSKDVEKVVREARNVFRELPVFEGNTYTFIADWLPWANSDGMEHRNSTVLTNPMSIRNDRFVLLDSLSHEFFHAWNVERIRPRSLEPFNFDDQNISGELWLAEGFTNYYGPLILQRSGIRRVSQFAADMGTTLNTVLVSPGRQLRTAEEMSQMAPFVDAAAAIDRTSFDNTFISYYTWGSAIALGLDLTLRVQTDNRVTLDDLMRALWRKYGKPGGKAAGYVDRPYTMDDVRTTLGEVANNQPFADDFFQKYIQGHEVIDYAPLLARAGLVWRAAGGGQSSIGLLRLQDASGGARIAAAVPFGSPAYLAGLDRDDVIVAFGTTTISDVVGFGKALEEHQPGERVQLTFDRRGQRVTTTVTIGGDPRRELVPVEETGGALTAAQRRFRDAWLGPTARNTN